MASSKDAVRRQRRRELDARRSKSRVRLGACLPHWGKLKDSLGFTLHSELAQYLLESYISKASAKCSCSREESAIMASVEALHRLVLLVHSHGQHCPHPPSLQQGAVTAGSTPCPEQSRAPPSGTPELGTNANVGSESGPTSTGVGPAESPEVMEGELCLSYACESGHVFSWSPKAAPLGGEGSGGGGGATGADTSLTADAPRGPSLTADAPRDTSLTADAPRGPSLTADAPREGGPRGNGVDEGGARVDEGSVMRTRSRTVAGTEMPTSHQAAQGAEEGSRGQVERPGHTAEEASTREGSGPVDTDAGNVAVPTGFPQSSQPCTESATLSKVANVTPNKRTDPSDHSSLAAGPVSRTTSRTSVPSDEVPLTGGKRKRKATPKEILLCTYEGCEKIFSNRQYLNHHTKYQHVQQKTFICSHPTCGKSFNFKKHLKEHEKLHSDQRDYICEYCARGFRTSSNLLIHRRIHTGEKPLQCEVCGFTCCQKASLNWHMRKHNAESSYQFPCDICGRRFEKRDNVTAHRSKSHPDYPASAGASSALSAPVASTAPSPAPTEVCITYQGC
ncbi:zinc finger protein 692 isoform X1 [Alosa sapidissima]|uniref:zinc finger protein 692 isoform X1 n=1 Tax=Alosa sapidissima TaxID=34773 RepID=UPI001C0984B8|nr:zinc finger protein 692 isoform X1 [Alosa sapidissima]XP_041967491.1 zinc finger protein 692 isoform X1 [Alosa sapidissima]